MIKLKLIDDHFITKIDSMNWAVARTIEMKKGKTKGKFRTYYLGYYPNLTLAVQGAISTLLFQANTNDELKEIISKIDLMINAANFLVRQRYREKNTKVNDNTKSKKLSAIN